jgi:hypothetical protein
MTMAMATAFAFGRTEKIVKIKFCMTIIIVIIIKNITIKIIEIRIIYYWIT